jgi:hypothetical protein
MSVEPGIDHNNQPTANGSMPIGNGDSVLTLWPNKTSSALEFYIAKTDAMASDTALFKVGKV